MADSVGISTPVSDIDGARVLKQAPSMIRANDEIRRRVSREPTLDGGASVYDTGYSAAERTFTIRTPDPGGDIYKWAARIVETYSSVTLATRTGIFAGVPSRCWVSEDRCCIEILVTEEL